MSKRDILAYTKSLVRAGVMERPLWMAAVERTPPLPAGKPGKRPPSITYPEDELIDAYYRKHPEARLEPIDMASFEPPTARRFALRQLELIEREGMSKRAAAAVAEEELHLQQALRQYADSHGPTQVRQHAKELWQSQHAASSSKAGQLRRKNQQEGGKPQPKAAAAAPQADS
uniref:Small ribosomal subunit protein mS23 n=1 Tax=Chlorella ohadii TaxID=2649997 RepID=A0AAD5DZR7_9CHLO